ncbi:MAG: SpoIIE family protein phosphatase [Clostridia bacterium]|nr:SpoIIE family protein phosphatase [Clostridia bacterium]
MKTIRKNFNFTAFIIYGFLFFGFLSFSKLDGLVMPYSASLLTFALSVGSSIILTPILFLLNFIALGNVGILPSMAITCAFNMMLALIYKRGKRSNGLSFCSFNAVGLIGYVFLGDGNTFISLEQRIIVCGLSALLCLLFWVGGNAVINKRLKYKFGYDESACLITLVIVLGVGISNFISPLFWKGVCAVVALLSCYFFSIGKGTLLCGVVGASLSLYYGNISLVSVFLIWGLATNAVMPLNRFAGAFTLPLCDLLIQLIFSAYNSYFLADFLPVLIGAVIFCIIPTKLISGVKDRLDFFKEKQLVRQTINRNKLMLSNRLYELSGVFTEIKATFNAFNKSENTTETSKRIILKQTLEDVCERCDKNKLCIKNKKARNESVEKMIDIGFAKGKLSLIDLPKNLGDTCANPSELLYSLNKLLAGYRNYCLEKKNASIGRELLAEEAQGVAEILRGLALESGTLLTFQSKYEKVLTENLFKAGFIASELLIYGEGERLSVSMILAMKEYSVFALQKLVSKTLGTDMILCDKNDISEDKVYLVFKRQAPFDAVFGVANVVKDGSNKSGDTHSVMKLSDDKFLVALSDGMGSGENAEKVSSTALSLIESFYKAGLSGDLILNTVNKILSINTEECFTALDISVVDLRTCKADFIKYGSPYGFIISENGIKIIEGNTLPLGILEELKPSVCQTELKEESTLLFVTDGISDAFGSSNEIIDYLRSVPALNPQSLADGIVVKAKELNHDKPADDMTALAVRIYKKKAV